MVFRVKYFNACADEGSSAQLPLSSRVTSSLYTYHPQLPPHLIRRETVDELRPPEKIKGSIISSEPSQTTEVSELVDKQRPSPQARS